MDSVRVGSAGTQDEGSPPCLAPRPAFPRRETDCVLLSWGHRSPSDLNPVSDEGDKKKKTTT